MIRNVVACVLGLLMSAMLVAQQPELIRGDAKMRLSEVSSAITQEVGADLSVFSVHEDGLVSLAAIGDDGTLLMSYATNSRSRSVAPQGPVTGAPVPVLEASWCDADGVAWKVTTPIDSSTPSGIDRAVDLHERLVARLQVKHPPRPCPTPP